MRGAAKEMEIVMERETRKTSPRGWGARVLTPAAAFVLVLAVALPAAGQASRTRPQDDRGSGGAPAASPAPSAPPSAPSSTPGTTSRPTPRSGGPAVDTRPPGSTGGGVIGVDNRTRRPGGYYPGYYPGRYYSDYWYPYRYSWWLGYWGWYGWPYPYYPYPHTVPYYGYGGGGYPYEPAYYGSRVRPSMGALDLDLKPGDTQIWLNGQLIGTADSFDGWPQYLWLEEGDYHFVFFYPGRRTIAREYKVYPGVVIDVEDRLEEGESTPPEELFPVPTARREARLRDNDETRRRAEAEAAADWRQRAEAIRAREAREADEALGDAKFGSVVLDIEPRDSSVYIDGRFVGTAEELARLPNGITVEPGEHEIQVVRPGHGPETTTFDIEHGEEVTFRTRLDPE